MAAERKAPWRMAAALLLLVTLPAYGLIPPLPPTSPAARAVTRELVSAPPAVLELTILVSCAALDEATGAAAPPAGWPKTRVRVFDLAAANQRQAIAWFSCEIAVGQEAVDYLVDTAGPLSQVVGETASSGGGPAVLSAYYVRGDDLLAVMRPGETAGTWNSRFYHADGLGSIRALTDESGGVTDRYTFTAFGELLSHEGEDPNAFLFAGEMLDGVTGLAYHRARWMDPSAGRFASIDPELGHVTRPITQHGYLYAGQSPTLYMDPTGRQLAPSVMAALIVVGIIALVAVSVLGPQYASPLQGRP